MREVALGEALDVLIDHRGKTPKKLGGDFTPSGVKVVSAIHIKNGRINWEERERYVSVPMFQRWMPEPTRRGDVLLTSEAPLGEVAQVEDDEPLVLSQRLFALRGKQGLLDSTYLRYFLQSDFGRQRLLAMATGSTVSGIRQELLRQVRVPLPPLDEQERIAGVLGAFDDLIETNRRLASQLDQARTARVAAALAGSSFETRLSDVAAFVNGRNFTKGADGNGRPVIRTPEVRSGPVGNTVWSSVDADADRVANAGDILFVWSGTLMVNRWLYTDGLVNQHVFKVIPNGVPDWYVYALIEAQLSWFLGLAKDKATTMGHIQRAHLDEPMIGLDPNTIQSLGGAIEPLWSAALDLRIEAQDLARQRDELLPLLMSGKVRVRDVEAASL